MGQLTSVSAAKIMLLVGSCCLLVTGGCSGGNQDDPDGSADGDADSDSDGDAEPLHCQDDDECDDGVFCNGVERCEPGDEDADEDGCLPGEGDPCLEGQSCDEAEGRCLTDCDVSGDADADGHQATECGGDDCDDSDGTRFPGNPETCDATDPEDPETHDEDCNPATFGPDRDGDGFVHVACCNETATGDLACGEDCDDDSAEVNPEAPEACNGVDDDCDGTVDNGVLTTYWPDGDGDGFGNPAGPSVDACTQPAGYVADDTDCDDAEGGRNPGASEACDHVHDNDCDGANPHDADGDHHDASWCGGDDCDDEHVTVHPGAGEVCDHYGDNDCDGSSPHDGDGDGYDDSSCGGNDCDDAEETVYPGAPEVCDALGDNNCDGASPWDSDGDGFDDAGCGGPDCNDSAPTVHPGAAEVCDALGDNDCDGASPHDGDVDGYDDSSCGGNDCDDAEETIYPGAPELCDRRDNDCSAGGGVATDEDADDDGFAPEGTTICAGGPLPATDCYDSEARAFPGQLSFFPDPFDGTSSLYDYNCDTDEEPRWTDRGQCTNIGIGCAFVRGWDLGPLEFPPGCGGWGMLLEGCDATCSPTRWVGTSQECR